jgi:soluble lytic murein transglycosylase
VTASWHAPARRATLLGAGGAFGGVALVAARAAVAALALLAPRADPARAAAPAAADALAIPAADPSLIEAYRTLGFRDLLSEALERALPAAAASDRAALARELAAERLRAGKPAAALALLTGAGAGGPEAAFARAIALRDAGCLEAALEAFDACDTSTAPLAELPDVVAYLCGTTAHRLGRLDRAAADLSRAALLGESALVRESAERGLLFALVEIDSIDGAWRRLRDGGPIARLNDPELVLFLGERLVGVGRGAAAESLYDRACDGFRGQPSALAAFDALRQLRERRGEPPDAAAWLRGAALAIDAGAWREGVDAAERAERSARSPAEADSARLLRGKALYKGERWDAAAERLRDLLEATADSTVGREALLFLARSERRAGRAERARALYERFLVAFAGDPFCEEVLWDLAWADRKAGKASAARARFHVIAKRLPSGKRGDEALFQEALACAALGAPGEAERDLERLTARAPAAPLAAQALFFRARLARGRGDERHAAALLDSLVDEFPDSFYATYVVGAASGPEAAWRPPPDGAWRLADRAARAYSARRELDAARSWVGPAAADDDTLADARRLRRAALLASAGLTDLLEAELALFEAEGEKGAWRDFLLARLYRRYGLHDRALGAGSRFANARRGGRPIEIARFLYPSAYLDVAVRAARAANLDPRLLLAIAREESWFDADVVSAAGAIGLCQIMPATGRATARALGEPDLEAWALREPSVSLRLGAAYLASLLREFDGSLILSAAAYNGGEGNAREWRTFYQADDPPASIEAIAFTETRGYVKKILRSVWAYEAAYPLEPEPRWPDAP